MKPIRKRSMQLSNTVNPDTSEVCCVIVIYFPDKELNSRLKTLRHQVEKMVIVDNTPITREKEDSLLNLVESLDIHYIKNKSNVGLARGLNQGLEYALQQKSKWMLTFDQDTYWYTNVVQTLLNISENCHLKPYVIGSNYFDIKRNKLETKKDKKKEWKKRKTVITSGCLINTSFAKKIGAFREDYFIDQVDHEFCLRARSQGGNIVISTKPIMGHSVGGQLGPKIPLTNILLPEHSPIRKYYIARNSIVTIKLYWRIEPIWCLKRLAKLLIGTLGIAIIEKNRRKKLKAHLQGLVDGIHNRLGPTEKAFLL